MGMSAPKAIRLHLDLSVWVTVVHGAALDAVSSPMTTLDQDPTTIRRDGKGVIEVW
jgi:hypothetical protein